MTDCILLIGHGSRQEDGNEEIRRFADLLAEHYPDWLLETCFIEFADPLLGEGLDRAAARADRVIAVPLILNAAGHVKLEVPEQIEAARARHPGVDFRLARHLGVSETTLGLVERRLRDAMQALSVPDPRTTGVILLGRGSSDRTANGELARLGRWLYEGGEHELVDIAFTGVTHPRLEAVVRRHSLLGMTQQVVLPYYLFTGRLIERIEQQVARLRVQYPQTAFALADYLGFEPEVFALIAQRVEEARAGQAMLECDGCPHRAAAAHHHHHHHH
ncbi:sirohydrochlorin chelatase [Halorhodospira halophila]|uniref:Cobalamin (Vitamin B12) biosynthesis CbiX protein n=1 Tax=Halorhodospira halophila (strain DSM 244 / SL1) TaxID=349124 RepID=A1WWQ5_HALHL|nr:sirohydrochlorin chelatase [Halorhodospira halophila]ABM62117.1 cobalamin (vitamin B12) biosynthesis CbiX protein [Halorhodospira halophila SL1]MBK1729445.1 sirohydrochlorin chelatase [Halorhodospira halophila]